MSESENIKVRLLFEKKGRSAFISHLDLMQTLSEGFRRAGLKLKHTQGFNRRPYISLARPLSLGFESEYELCDVVLTQSEDIPSLPERLNPFFPEGIIIKKAYSGEDALHPKHICWSDYKIEAEFETPPRHAAEALQKLFSQSVVVPKRTKKKVKPVDISGMIKSLSTHEQENGIIIFAMLKDAQDGSLNPTYLTAAAEEKIQGFSPLDVSYTRTGLFDENGRLAI